ncbi:MAG: hypothetical protein QME48_05825 [bacterium]|nr:hypothetical protein [bacterium]
MVGELGRWEYGPTEAIAVKGNTAYISSGSYLWVMDISNESNPRLISEMKLENYIHYIRRIGNYLYVSKNDTLLNIYDIHTDTVPMLVNQIEGTNSEYPWYDVYVDGDTLWIGGDGTIQYVINDTINLQYVRWVVLGEQFARKDSVGISLLTDYKSIRVCNLNRTGNLLLPDDDITFTEKIRGIKVTYPYVYFGYGSKGIGIMDISNLYDIKLKKTVLTGGNTYDVEMIEDTILIAARGLNGIGIYDVEYDTLLTEIGSCETNGYTYELEVIGNRLYAGARSGGLIIVDITDKSNPTVVGEYRGYGESRRMAIEGDRLYVASGDGGVMIMDITDRENPEVISQCWTRDIGEDVVKGGDYLYVADGDSGLTVVDISDEYNPSVVAGIVNEHYGNFVDINQARNYLVLSGKEGESSDTLENGITIYNISSPMSPLKSKELMKGQPYSREPVLMDTLIYTMYNEGNLNWYMSIKGYNIKDIYNAILIDSISYYQGIGSGFIEIGNYFYYTRTNNNNDSLIRLDAGLNQLTIKLDEDLSYTSKEIQGNLLQMKYRNIRIWDLSGDTVIKDIIKDDVNYYIECDNEQNNFYVSYLNYGISVYGFDMVPPSKITLIEPQDGDTAYNNSMEVTWHKSTDTGVGIDRYEVYVNGIEEGETTDTSMVVNTTSTGTRNVWVKVYDRVGNSSYSDTNAVYLLTGIEGKDETRVTDKELTIKTTLNRISVYNGTTEKQEIEVLDIMGRVVEKRELKQKEKYELSPKSGIYFIRSGKNKTSKIAVIK